MFYQPLIILISVSALLGNAYIPSWDQIRQGRVPGALQPDAHGDYLMETRCNCTPGIVTMHDFNHVYLWEYYNNHQNATFLMVNTTGIFKREPYSPNRPFPHNDVCRKYPRPQPIKPKHRKEDKLCFYPWNNIDGYLQSGHKNATKLSWNNQDRKLGWNGGQGLTFTSDSLVNNEICPNICKDFMEDAGVEGDITGTGYQNIWKDVDDMCDHCK